MTKSPNTEDKEKQEAQIELLESEIEYLDAQILEESKKDKCDIDKCIDLLGKQTEKESHLEYLNNVIGGVVSKTPRAALRAVYKSASNNKPGLSSQG